MVNLDRNEPAPICLQAKIDYKCGDVLEKLEKVFFGKCYICETDLFSKNVEHFCAHKGNTSLKFDWNNIFLACNHCNNIKLSTDILNCTNPKHDVEDRIVYNSISYIEQPIEIKANINFKKDKLTKNTVILLNKVFNGHTKIKSRDANTLKEYFIEEMLQFQKLMLDYNKERNNKYKLAAIEENIKAELHKGSKLTAFKRQIIKNYSNYHSLMEYFD